jgi:NAD(P)-dependent dehydrogenase (short-subunit alcohol dehydrogenase family)
MRISLEGQKALVTGASRGIGRAIALLFAKAGADVAVHYNTAEQAAAETVSKIEAEGVRGWMMQADLDQPSQVVRLADEARSKMGGITILVNNAGYFQSCPIESPEAIECYERTMRINLEAPFILSHRLGPGMKGGVILNISSRSSRRGEDSNSPYAVSKGGLNLLTVSLARELAPHGVRVNAVAPGWVETAMARDAFKDPERRKEIEGQSVLGRVASVDDVAEVSLFLASPMSEYITGQIVHLNGGSFLNTG